MGVRACAWVAMRGATVWIALSCPAYRSSCSQLPITHLLAEQGGRTRPGPSGRAGERA